MSVAQTLTPTEHSHSPSGDRLVKRTAWHIDPTTSRVEFTVRKRWFVVPLPVTGRFSDVQGVITLDEQDPITVQASITIAASSIDSCHLRRDAHLRPEVSFHI